MKPSRGEQTEGAFRSGGRRGAGRVGVMACMALLFASMRQASALHAQPTWTLGPQPTVVIADDGTPATEFSLVRQATRLPDGRLLVAEPRSAELRLFSREGRFERIVARQGEGPGELDAVRAMRRVGETLQVIGNVRMMTFSLATWREVSRQPLDIRARGTRASGFLGDGTAFGARSPGFRIIEQPETRLMRDSVEYVLLRADSTVPSIGKRLGGTGLMLESATAPAGFRSGRLRFGHALHLAAGNSVLWFGDSESRWIGRMHARTGRLDSVANPVAATAWDEAAIRRVRERVLRERTQAAERELPLALLEPRWRPRVRPTFSALHADGDGVWVERFTEDEQAPRGVLVLDRSGAVVAQLTLPAGLEVLEVGPDYVLGTRLDGDDVPSVELWPLRRGR